MLDRFGNCAVYFMNIILRAKPFYRFVSEHCMMLVLVEKPVNRDLGRSICYLTFSVA